MNDDTYGAVVQYWCVNGSQFDVPNGPNISIETKSVKIYITGVHTLSKCLVACGVKCGILFLPCLSV